MTEPNEPTQPPVSLEHDAAGLPIDPTTEPPLYTDGEPVAPESETHYATTEQPAVVDEPLALGELPEGGVPEGGLVSGETGDAEPGPAVVSSLTDEGELPVTVDQDTTEDGEPIYSWGPRVEANGHGVHVAQLADGRVRIKPGSYSGQEFEADSEEEGLAMVPFVG